MFLIKLNKRGHQSLKSLRWLKTKLRINWREKVLGWNQLKNCSLRCVFDFLLIGFRLEELFHRFEIVLGMGCQLFHEIVDFRVAKKFTPLLLFRFCCWLRWSLLNWVSNYWGFHRFFFYFGWRLLLDIFLLLHFNPLFFFFLILHFLHNFFDLDLKPKVLHDHSEFFN